MLVNITASGATTPYTGLIRKALLTINTGLTGTITVTDNSSTPIAVGVITNPVTGGRYEYWTLNGIIVNPSGTCDITVNLDLSRQATAM